MKTKEANKIIAEHMGGPYVGDACQDSLGVNAGYPCCTTTEICERCEDIDEHYLSLDALVPVWEKYHLQPIPELFQGFWKCSIQNRDSGLVFTYDDGYNELEEAAAIATAKVLREIKP